MFLLLFPTLMWNFMSRRWFHTGLFWGQWPQSWAEVPFCLHEIPSTVCFWKQDLSCTTDVSSREEDKSAKLPECRDQIRSLEWGTRLTQVACPHQNINCSSLRGVWEVTQPAALLWKIAHACKGTNINLQTKFKCLCDSRWRLKIASASGSAGTLVFMILLLFRNSKLDQWETLLSWPVVQFAARKYRHWNLTNTSTNPLHSLVGRVKIASWWCSQMQTSEIWQILSKNWIIPSKMEVSTARMSYDFKMSSDYNHGVLKL